MDVDDNDDTRKIFITKRVSDDFLYCMKKKYFINLIDFLEDFLELFR